MILKGVNLETGQVSQMSPEEGLFELTLLNAEKQNSDFEEVFLEGIRRGIPPEILTRLKDLWETTKEVAGEIVAIGKIIVLAIIDFLKANVTMTVGMALGAAVSSLVFAIPFIGPLLAPLAMTISAAYGAGVGAAIESGDMTPSPYTAAIALADRFFELLRQILLAISNYWS